MRRRKRLPHGAGLWQLLPHADHPIARRRVLRASRHRSGEEARGQAAAVARRNRRRRARDGVADDRRRRYPDLHAGQRAQGDRPTRAELRAAPCRSDADSRQRQMVGRDQHLSRAGQLRRAMGRCYREEEAARRCHGWRPGRICPRGRGAERANDAPRQFREHRRVRRRRLAGRVGWQDELADALLRHGGGRPRPRAVGRQQRRTVCGDRPRAARARPQYRVGRAG